MGRAKEKHKNEAKPEEYTVMIPVPIMARTPEEAREKTMRLKVMLDGKEIQHVSGVLEATDGGRQD